MPRSINRQRSTMASEPNTIEAQAIDWVVRLDAGALTAEEQAQLDTWLAEDPRHRGAFVQADCSWLELGRLASLRAGSVAAPSVKPTPVRRLPWRIAAALGALSVGAAAWYGYVKLAPSETYTSVIGEVRNIELVDGSHLTLNTNTVAKVEFQPETRDISLERGEALFQVAHDVNRPFVVHANDVQIRAVGTAFTVRVDGPRTDVLVTEGTVEISRKGESRREVRRVVAHQRALLASPVSQPDIQPVAPEAIDRELAWREGKASFVGEPLGTAAMEINRHSRLQIVIDDPELATQPVIGVFNANDAKAFANAAAMSFGAEVVIKGTEIHLR